MNENQISKPKNRSQLRRQLGKEYFCIKRKMKWLTDENTYASQQDLEPLEFTLINHQSFLLKKLKDVDMYLQHNKTVNLQLAMAKLNGIIIKPGETFSFWKLVGRPTKKKGYLDGLSLSNGQIGKDTGGGLCQLGNLIYWMIIHTPLTVKQRWRHSYDVFPDVNRTIPFGSGATLSYNYIDLQFKNETEYDYQLNIWIEGKFVRSSLCSTSELTHTYRVFETDHKFELQWWGGYTRHNKIWREKTLKSSTNEFAKESITELVTENHAVMMYNPLLGE
jgi:vancomycin resistance protein VanW